jgi:hypothetical protein
VGCIPTKALLRSTEIYRNDHAFRQRYCDNKAMMPSKTLNPLEMKCINSPGVVFLVRCTTSGNIQFTGSINGIAHHLDI